MQLATDSDSASASRSQSATIHKQGRLINLLKPQWSYASFSVKFPSTHNRYDVVENRHEMAVDEDFVEGMSDARNQIQKKTLRARKMRRTSTLRMRLKEILSAYYFSVAHHSADQSNLSHPVQHEWLWGMSSNDGAGGSRLEFQPSGEGSRFQGSPWY